MSGFRVFRNFNKGSYWLAGWKTRLDAVAARKLGQRGRVGRLIEALAVAETVKVKEVVESLEFYACVRRRLKGPEVVDLCCGHGLTGLLFAVFDDQLEGVTLLDRRRTPVLEAVTDCVKAAFPEVAARVRFVEGTLKTAAEHLRPGAVLVAVHACGLRTDRCLDLAIERGLPIGALPCCYTGTGKGAPEAVRRSLGVPVAADIERTYRLEEAGFSVEWDEIPQAITPMNRVLLAHPGRRRFS